VLLVTGCWAGCQAVGCVDTITEAILPASNAVRRIPADSASVLGLGGLLLVTFYIGRVRSSSPRPWVAQREGLKRSSPLPPPIRKPALPAASPCHNPL